MLWKLASSQGAFKEIERRTVPASWPGVERYFLRGFEKKSISFNYQSCKEYLGSAHKNVPSAKEHQEETRNTSKNGGNYGGDRPLFRGGKPNCQY